MLNSTSNRRAAILGLLLLTLLGHARLAHAQNFTLSLSPLRPPAIDPGGISTSIVDLQGSGGPVSLSCVVTSTQVTTNLPVCVVSPTSQTPPADGPSVTITTTGLTPAGGYTITVTGTDGSSPQTATLFLNVVDVLQDYTLSVTQAISPGTVTAGLGAQATVTVTPIVGYTGNVTLACLSVTPIVTAAPVCSFNPATVAVTNGSAPSSVLTISTFGSAASTQAWRPNRLYAFWLALPGLAMVGIGTRRRKNFIGAFLLLLILSGLLLMPACNASNTTGTTAPNGDATPKNTYIFTLTGADENGAGPSNTTTDPATVTLTVD